MPPRPKPAVDVPVFPKPKSNFTCTGNIGRPTTDEPPRLGMYPLPSGRPGCLNGLTFVLTGTLRSLMKEQAKDLIESYGGKVTSAVSGKTTAVIRGSTNVGPTKIEAAVSKGIQVIDEESLFEFIEKSNVTIPVISSDPVATPTQSKTKGKGIVVTKVIPDFAPAKSRYKTIGYQSRKKADRPPQYKKIPTPRPIPGCFSGLTFVITGILRSLKREQAQALIESCGGKVTGSISGRTDIILRGVINVGESKIAKAVTQGIKIIDEESLFDFLEKNNQENPQPEPIIPPVRAAPPVRATPPVRVTPPVPSAPRIAPPVPSAPRIAPPIPSAPRIAPPVRAEPTAYSAQAGLTARQNSNEPQGTSIPQGLAMQQVLNMIQRFGISNLGAQLGISTQQKSGTQQDTGKYQGLGTADSPIII